MSALARNLYDFAKANWTERRSVPFDPYLLIAALSILCLGVLFVASASIAQADALYGDSWYFLKRHLLYVLLGLSLGVFALFMPLRIWFEAAPLLIVISLIMLALVLVPGIGKTVNGSSRWLNLGVATIQVSEMIKLFMIIYLASYMTRHFEAVQTRMRGFVVPLLVYGIIALLLLAEPDFGATVVLGVIVMSLLLLAGVKLGRLLLLLGVMTLAAVILIVSSPYRMERMTAFMNPWKDPFDSGFQLSQALIAFGRGEWFGVGLGGSLQKMFYLPEAHTDFVLSIWAEETGFFGVLLVIALFAVFCWRAVNVALTAERLQNHFGAYLGYGIAIWITTQAFINMGVNMGVLPTKGITLPLMSYGGSSLVCSIVAVMLLLGVDRVNRRMQQGGRP